MVVLVGNFKALEKPLIERLVSENIEDIKFECASAQSKNNWEEKLVGQSA